MRGSASTGTPANLSAPERAKFCDTASWPSASTLMQKRPIVAQLRPGRATCAAGREDDQRRVQRQRAERLAGEADRAVVGHRGDHGDAGGEVAQHVAHAPAGRRSRGALSAAAHRRRARGTERPPARYSELGSSCPTACSVTRAAAEDGVEVQAGADAGLLEHVDQLLGGDVAAGARRERAAARARRPRSPAG